MELDELKQIWKTNDKHFTIRNEDELMTMLQGRSKSAVSKIKRNVWLELIFSFVASILFLLYSFTLPSGALKSTAISIILLFIGYSFYYIKKILLLRRFNPGDHNLRESLQHLVDNLNSYVKFYRSSYLILYPVYFLLGLLFGFIQTDLEKFIHIITQPVTIVYLVITAAVFFFAGTWLTTWYLDKLYGMHIKKLKAVISELEKDQNELES